MNKKEKKIKVLVLSLIASLLIFIPFLAMPQKTEAAAVNSMSFSVEYNQTEARKMLDQVNKLRGSNNKLYLDADLEKYAMQRAAEIIFSFSAKRLNGQSGISMISGNIYKGENFSKGQKNSKAAVDAFYSSTGHRNNMLNKNFRAAGFSCVKFNNRYYYVQMFSSTKLIKKPGTALNGSRAVFIPATSYTGFGIKNGDWLYYNNGKDTSNVTNVIKGSVKDTSTWWYVKKGKVDFSYTGLVKGSDNKWYYVTKGQYDKKYVGLSRTTSDSKKIYYVKDGTWQNKYTGKITYNKKTYNIKAGKVV